MDVITSNNLRWKFHKKNFVLLYHNISFMRRFYFLTSLIFLQSVPVNIFKPEHFVYKIVPM
jgi:hypothetical protein